MAHHKACYSTDVAPLTRFATTLLCVLPIALTDYQDILNFKILVGTSTGHFLFSNNKYTINREESLSV